MQEPRAVVIGYGFAGRSFHSYLIGLTPGLRLHGIAARQPAVQERIRQERGCKVYASFEAVLADPEVDLVVLATPTHTHCDQAVRAMEAGKHVVTDKPMALTVAECDRMIETAQRQGVLLSVFQNRRWDGDFLTVQKAIRDGALGQANWVEMAWGRWGAPGGWRGQWDEGGGRYYDLGAHLCDQLAVLFPQPIESVYCRMQHDFAERDVESEALLVVTFAGGATGVCDISSRAAIAKPRFYVRGSGGNLVKFGLDPQEDAMKAGDIDAARDDPATYARLSDGQTERILPTVPGRWRSYYEDIARVLTHGGQPAVQPAQVRRAIALLEAGVQSARSGQVVRLSV